MRLIVTVFYFIFLFSEIKAKLYCVISFITYNELTERSDYVKIHYK